MSFATAVSDPNLGRAGRPSGLRGLAARLRRDPDLPPFSGPRILVLSAVLLMMSTPGQTSGVSVFIDPMMEGLGVTRWQVSTAYLVGTMLGALGLPAVGRYLDLRGPRRATMIIGAAFSAALIGMSAVGNLVFLALGFTGIRLLGQGGLSIVAGIAPGRWYERRRGAAIVATTSIGSAAAVTIPLLSTIIIINFGWRQAWLVLATLVWLIVVSIGRWGLIDDPSDIGQRLDGNASEGAAQDVTTSGTTSRPTRRSFTAREAMRTPVFWSVLLVVVVASLVVTGVNFHQISILGEQGLTPIQAATNYVPQTFAGLAVSLWAGIQIDRVHPRFMAVAMLILLAGTLTSVSLVQPGLRAALFGAVLGSTQGIMRAVESAAYPVIFGMRHAGEIRGIVRSVAVGASALGPLLIAAGYEATGSYQRVFNGLLPLLVISIVVVLLVPDTTRSTPDPDEHPGGTPQAVPAS